MTQSSHHRVERRRIVDAALPLLFLAVSCASHPSTEKLIGIREGSSVPSAADVVLYSCQMWAGTYELWTGGPRDHICAKAAPGGQSSDMALERLAQGTPIKVKNALFIDGIDATYLYFTASAETGGKNRNFFIEDAHVAKLLGVTLRRE